MGFLAEIFMKKAKHFAIPELVCRDVYDRDGENAWRYFRPVVIDFLDWIREEWGRPITVNDWLWGGAETQRGLRCNLCQLVKKKETLYVSAHMLGAGIDFNIKAINPEGVRIWLQCNIHRFFVKFPQYKAKIRIESKEFAPTWVHIDFYDHDGLRIIQYIEPIS